MKKESRDLVVSAGHLWQKGEKTSTTPSQIRPDWSQLNESLSHAPVTGCEHRYLKGDYRKLHSVVQVNRPDRAYPSITWADISPIDVIFSLVAIFPELGFPSRDIKHVCICLTLSVKLKAQISAFRLWESPRRKRSKDDTVKETANPSSEKMTIVARVIALKGMPIGKTLVGSLLQLRDHRVTLRKRKKERPICLILSRNSTKRSCQSR